ncbi:MAG: diphthine--ammonia ligase [Candidatus Bathyarchaeia archaeon]|jgi:ABC transporter with metal-binding/Fe-S-binding domain ATP-binding protein
MRLGVLFSGGKDSTLALQVAAQKEEVVGLITILSRNKESFMYHTPNIEISGLQAEALGLPQITRTTQGEKEKELSELEDAIAEAKMKFQIEGVVTGAVESVYQAERVQRICNHLGLWCFNPLWKHDQKALLEELLEERYEVIISGVFAYPLDETWLGKQIDTKLIDRLVVLQEKYGLSPAGEGGEIETTVLDAPLFKKKIEVVDYSVEFKGNSGVFIIKQARLISK